MNASRERVRKDVVEDVLEDVDVGSVGDVVVGSGDVVGKVDDADKVEVVKFGGGICIAKHYKGDGYYYFPGKMFLDDTELLTEMDNEDKETLKEQIERVKKSIEKNLLSHFGCVDAVDCSIDPKRDKVR